MYSLLSGNFHKCGVDPAASALRRNILYLSNCIESLTKRTLSQTQVQVSETTAEDIMDESLPCGQPRVESTMVGLGPDRGGSLLPDSTETNKLQSSPKIGDAMVVTNNKETSKSNKEDSKSTRNIKGTGQDKTKENYKYFLKGWCRHGFSGRVEKDEVKECLFTHPPICRKYMDQGVMVCKKGSKCFLKNVTVCKESRKKKTCLSSQEVKRYIIGYHIK